MAPTNFWVLSRSGLSAVGVSPKLSVAGKQLDLLQGSVFILVVGVAIAGYGGYEYQQQAQTLSDTTTIEATITDAGVETIPQRRGRTDYEPTVTFEYQYDGTTYTGNDIRPSSIATDYDTRSAAEDALSEYEVGETVTAYVNPASPGQAFLEDRPSKGPMKFVVVGGVTALVGAASTLRSGGDTAHE